MMFNSIYLCNLREDRWDDYSTYASAIKADSVIA